MVPASTSTAPPALIPRAALFPTTELANPQLAPDGRRLAYLAAVDGVANIHVATPGEPGTPVTADTGRGIHEFTWAADARHVLYLQDEGGNENWRLFAVDLDADATRVLTPWEGVQVHLVGTAADHPDAVTFTANKDNPALHDVYQANLSTGAVDKIETNPGFSRWIFDAQRRVRGGLRPLDDGSVQIQIRDGAGWRTVTTIPADDTGSGVFLEGPLATPFSVTSDGRSLITLSSVGADRARAVAVDLRTGEPTVLGEDPHYDVAGYWIHPGVAPPVLTLHPTTGAVQIMTVVGERARHVALDPDVAGDVARLDAFDGGDWFIQSRSRDDSLWIVGIHADTAPVTYYLYDRGNGTTRLLFGSTPSLDNAPLAPMEPFRYTARDGLEVHGYLTFPLGAERRRLPTVIFVHGGPWARDWWGFNPQTQLFANRGYLTVQVNFRASTGYGKQFCTAGNKQWGAAMQDDLTDAVEHLVDQGLADGDRIGIYGGSYGGYAALCGAAFTPDLYACAAAGAAPVNLVSFLESIPAYWGPMLTFLKQRIGDPETEREQLLAHSPVSRAADIRIPLLLAYGENDPRVKLSEAEQIVAALQANGIEHELLILSDEGHDLVHHDNRMLLLQRTETLLARHLGGRCEP